MKKFYYPLTKLQDYHQSNLAVILLELQRKTTELTRQQQQVSQLQSHYQECDRALTVVSTNPSGVIASLHYRRELYQRCQQAYQQQQRIESEIVQISDAIKQEKQRIEQLKRHRQRQWRVFSENQRRVEYHLLDELHLSANNQELCNERIRHQ